MSDISAIASAAVAINQSQLLTKLSESMLKMNVEADQAVADMVIQNARQIEALSSAASGNIDIFV
jgi:hypothetical protein